MDPESNPQASYMGRLFGIRDVALAAGTLNSTGEARNLWLRLGRLWRRCRRGRRRARRPQRDAVQGQRGARLRPGRRRRRGGRHRAPPARRRPGLTLLPLAFEPSISPFVALLAIGFLVGILGHAVNSTGLVLVGIGLVFLATVVLPLIFFGNPY